MGERKPLDNHLERVDEEREVFQLPESRANWGPTEGPRTPELELGTTSGRATNDQIEHQARPIATAGWRTGHGSNQEAQTQNTAVEAAPKWLNLHRKPQGTA